jgi:hypothetical protein
MELAVEKLIAELNEEFPGIDARDASLFYGRATHGVWFAGTESATIRETFSFTEADGTVISESFDSPIFNMELHMDTLGTHPKLEKFLDDRGFYSEPYDAGTLMAHK